MLRGRMHCAGSCWALSRLDSNKIGWKFRSLFYSRGSMRVRLRFYYDMLCEYDPIPILLPNNCFDLEQRFFPFLFRLREMSYRSSSSELHLIPSNDHRSNYD